jgi:hypothetical protein
MHDDPMDKHYIKFFVAACENLDRRRHKNAVNWLSRLVAIVRGRRRKQRMLLQDDLP